MMDELKKPPAAPVDIMVVDDATANLQLLSSFFTQAGYHARLAANGRLALRSIAAKLPDLVLLDIRMPQMDGYEICRRLKADPHTADLPVIFISAQEDTGSKIKGFQVGGVDYITKPFQIEEVLARVETHLSLRRMQTALAQAKEEVELKVQQRTAELVQANRELDESRAAFKAVFDNMPDGYVMAGWDGVVQLVNPATARILGYDTPGELIGRNATEVYLDPQARDVLKSELLASQKVTGYEVMLKHKSGRRIITDFNARLVYDDAHRPAAVESLFRDITRQREANEKKDQLEKQLQQSQKMEALGTLAGGIAHDFNNILFAIWGYTEAALDQAPKRSTLGKYLLGVQEAGIRATDLVKQILAFSRQTASERKPIQPKYVIAEALKLLRASIPANIGFDIRISSKAYVLADVTQFHQIIMNLCINGWHAMAETGGTLSVTLSDLVLEDHTRTPWGLLAPGSYVVLAVEDTGCGIREPDLEKIFDPYFTTKAHDQGTGMGLALVRSIIDSCEGAIEVASRVGRGSRFKIYVPIAEPGADLASQSVDAAHRDKRAVKTVPADQTGNESILLVDNERAICDITKHLLQKSGCRVTALTDSRQALALLEENPAAFDLLITDFMLPHMTGDQLARAAHQLNADLPVIIMSGNPPARLHEMLKRQQVQRVITKPVTSQTLVESVRQALAGR